MRVLMMAILFVGCSSSQTLTPGPLGPANTLIGAAVELENLTEDPACDPHEVSTLELISDTINPLPMLGSVIGYYAAFIWGTGAALIGDPTDFERRYHQVRVYLPGYAGPDPSTPEGQAAYERLREELNAGRPGPTAQHLQGKKAPPAPAACQSGNSEAEWAKRTPECSPVGGSMSRGQAEELAKHAEGEGWTTIGFSEAGNKDRWSFKMHQTNSSTIFCIEDRLDYERKLAGLKLKEELIPPDKRTNP